MTQPEIEAFLTTVKLGSISAAASALFITQPALSRRLHALEGELGYPLLIRGKGIRSSLLTQEGIAFVPMAKKYIALWQEAKLIPASKGGIVKLSSVGSVSTYLLPEVVSCFLSAYPECNLQFHNYHSLEAYDHVARGALDMAFISDDMFSREVYTIPLFREAMVLALSSGEKYTHAAGPRDLDAGDEIRLPWNPEYDLWHGYWFSSSLHPRVELDQMSLLEYFLKQRDLWAILPAHVATCVKNISGVQIRSLTEGPPESYIYYLARDQTLSFQLESFLSLFKRSIRQNKDLTLLD